MRKNRKEQKNKNTKKRYVAGISWRLFGALALFVMLILIVIWVITASNTLSFLITVRLRSLTL